MSIHRRFAALATILSVLGLAGSAWAQPFSMTGKTSTGAGLFVRIPAAGPADCPSLTALRTGRPTMAPQMTAVWDAGGPYSTMVELHPLGCVPGGPATVTVNTTGGFTLPPGFFSRPASLVVVPVPDTPAVVQLATNWKVTGPPLSPIDPLAPRRNVGAMETTFPYAPWAAFMHSAWTNQTGRLGPNFTACPAPVGGLTTGYGFTSMQYPPSGAKVSCTYPSQGRIPGYVKNIAGPGGGFGGTMGLVLAETGVGTTGNLAVKAGVYMTLLVLPLQDMGSRPAGRGYAAYSNNYLPPGEIWLDYMLTTPGPYGLISMVTSYIGAGPYQTNQNFVFPWTTGNVVVRGTGVTYYGLNPQGGSFSLSGTDYTTTNGQRNIQLVAGAIAQSSVQGDNGTANYSIMRLPEPSGGLPLLAAVLALLGVAAWRVRQGR